LRAGAETILDRSVWAVLDREKRDTLLVRDEALEPESFARVLEHLAAACVFSQ